MNDITYRPFIRDSALGDINIQIPNLEIPVYKPRYSQPLEDDTETEVQSQVEEIRNPEPIVQETTVHKFNSKKDFKDTMLPIYERLLKSKGLNPAFAKSLVAQDGLESAWGSKPAGSYNFGGIKGKGTTKRTREVINGKDVYINDQFRNFKSLEDYANFKIDLLNNKRYNAFSGDIKEFANRVHRGGYATDPRYANILNQVIASAKHGGVLKFQQGGIQEGKQWLEDWYKSRKGSEGKGSFSVSQFDKNGKIIQSEPFNPEYKIVPEESTVTPHYNKENTYNLLNRYSDDFLLYLFNNVAQAPTKKKDATLYAQLGLKLPGFQNSIQVTDNERKPNLSYPVNTEYGDYIPNSNYPNLDYYHKFGQTDNKFKELAEILKPIFVQVLKEKNLPLTQVDNLVRQAALESQYGLDPRGSRGFNLGGIKWNNNQTDREWTKHKDGEKYIDFENLYDYAQYKVDLLNSRYNALTATSTNDFVDRLHGNNDTNSNYSQGKDNYIRTLNRTTSLNKYLSNNGQ